VYEGGEHGDGFGGLPIGEDTGHWSLSCVWWLHTLSQTEHVTNPFWASVSLLVVSMWVSSLLGDGSEHGLVLEGLGSNPESTTF